MLRVAAALALLLVSSPCVAAEWADAFPPSATASQVGASVPVIVVAGGFGAEPAAKAVRASLWEDGFPLVMDGASLGDLSELSDQAVVAAAANLPVERVLIVRAYPSSGDASVAAVTIFHLDGTSVGSFSINKNEVLSAKIVTAPRDQGVSDEVQPSESDLNAAKVTFRRQIVWFESRREYSSTMGWAAWGNPGLAIISRSRLRMSDEVPMLGERAQRLSWVEFYTEVGEAKFATAAGEAERRRARGKAMRLLGVTGFGLSAVSSASLALGGFFRTRCDSLPTEQLCGSPAAQIVVATNLAAHGIGSAVIWIAGHAMMKTKFEPHKPHELRQLAIDHNDALLDELGLTRQDVSASYRHRPTFRVVGLGAVPTPDGGVLSIAATF